jgi:inner membrane protein
LPTIFSHPAVAIAFWPSFRQKLPCSIFAAAALCSCLPDVDVVGFQFGIRYGDVFGHRGFTHSIFFAFLVSLLAAYAFCAQKKNRKLARAIFLFLFACTLSHGVLDAFTDGGLGVAFFSPFSNVRYFFPWRPIRVSAIGIADFLSGPVLRVLLSEIKSVWIPCLLIYAFSAILFKRANKETL